MASSSVTTYVARHSFPQTYKQQLSDTYQTTVRSFGLESAHEKVVFGGHAYKITGRDDGRYKVTRQTQYLSPFGRFIIRIAEFFKLDTGSQLERVVNRPIQRKAAFRNNDDWVKLRDDEGASNYYFRVLPFFNGLEERLAYERMVESFVPPELVSSRYPNEASPTQKR